MTSCANSSPAIGALNAAATDADPPKMVVLSGQPADPGTHRRAHVGQRAVLADRGAASQRQQGGQSRQHTAPKGHGRHRAVRGPDRLWRRVRALVGDAQGYEADDETAQRGHGEGHGDQPAAVRHPVAAPGGEVEQVVEPVDGLDEADREQRHDSANGDAKEGDDDDAPKRICELSVIRWHREPV